VIEGNGYFAMGLGSLYCKFSGLLMLLSQTVQFF